MTATRHHDHDAGAPLLELNQIPPAHKPSTEHPHMSSNAFSGNKRPLTPLFPTQDSSAHHRLAADNLSHKKPGAYAKIASSKGSDRERKLLQFGENHWGLEISAIILSICALVAIIVLLPLFENKPLTQWSLPISMNAILSILGATSRASLAFAISACISQGKWNWYCKRSDEIMTFNRFEEASRGPWGSIRLLWWTKLRNWTALGALSAVVLVGFEPFLQAIITFSGEEMDMPESSTAAAIGRTKRLDVGLHSYSYGDPMPGTLDGSFSRVTFEGKRSEYDFGALAAIWEGFSNLSSVDNLKPNFNCATGNCTWEPYTSLAVCAACYDISSYVARSSGEAVLNDSLITVFHQPDDDTHFSRNKTKKFPYTRYEIPDMDLSISNFHGIAQSSIYRTDQRVKDEYGGYSSWMVGAELTARATCRPSDTLSFRDSKTLIISFATIQASEEYRQRHQRWEESKVTSEECALYFCTNTYQSTVRQNVLNESILSSHSNRNLDSFTTEDLEAIDEYKAYNELTNYTLYWSSRDSKRTDLQLISPNENYSATTGTVEDNSQRFNVSYNTIGSVLSWFLEEFSRYPTPRSDKMLAYPTYGGETPALNALAASQNMTRTFENVAVSLTKWMRNRSLQTDPLAGTMKQWVIRIRVNWAFLSLPVGALIGGCIFCIWSILETRGLGLPAWKGSSLATLAHGLDESGRSLLREASSESEMDERARGMDVKFEYSQGGPELIPVNKV
ncbi:uncharacterized protein CTRU02_201447 [Colletotrichum truncatum]|uniref:Uncharacterized protein n=1 Tax=Colletotrichum truncatum TaxID=5467 RepID=A0ACC3ZHP3_COLTU|nr:uncharacterized protein CTRU02_14318 [Colletotrichum truncatum]KAF6782279.1 hypothetical protein CTRU02_14318 [Colletotrichum truncatum]